MYSLNKKFSALFYYLLTKIMVPNKIHLWRLEKGIGSERVWKRRTAYQEKSMTTIIKSPDLTVWKHVTKPLTFVRAGYQVILSTA